MLPLPVNITALGVQMRLRTRRAGRRAHRSETCWRRSSRAALWGERAVVSTCMQASCRRRSSRRSSRAAVVERRLCLVPLQHASAHYGALIVPLQPLDQLQRLLVARRTRAVVGTLHSGGGGEALGLEEGTCFKTRLFEELKARNGLEAPQPPPVLASQYGDGGGVRGRSSISSDPSSPQAHLTRHPPRGM